MGPSGHNLPMRILHIFDHSVPLHSGYTFRSLAILKEQRRRDWETFQLTSPKQGPIASLTEESGGFSFFRSTPRQDWSARLPIVRELALMQDLRRRIAEVAEQVRPDILHAHSPVLNALPALSVGRRLGLPVVYEVRAFWEDAAVDHGKGREGGGRYLLSKAIETRALLKADHVFTICQGLRNDIIGRGILADKVTVIPNAVDVDAFSSDIASGSTVRRDLGLGSDSVLGFIGSFYAYEGLDLLIKALPLVLAKIPNARLLFVGGGPQEAALKALAHSTGLDTKVIFAGRIPHGDIQGYYDAIDVLAYPRYSMRLTELVTPLKPLEAMAQKRLFVASDVGGHRELVEHGKTGLLFKAGDAKALASAIVDLLGKPGQHAELKEAGRAYVEKVRNWNNSVAGYAPVYERLASKRGRHG